MEINKLRAEVYAKFSEMNAKFNSIDVQLKVLFWLIGFLIALVFVYRSLV